MHHKQKSQGKNDAKHCASLFTNFWSQSYGAFDQNEL